jgi:hypothetical protein
MPSILFHARPASFWAAKGFDSHFSLSFSGTASFSRIFNLEHSPIKITFQSAALVSVVTITFALKLHRDACPIDEVHSSSPKNNRPKLSSDSLPDPSHPRHSKSLRISFALSAK